MVVKSVVNLNSIRLLIDKFDDVFFENESIKLPQVKILEMLFNNGNRHPGEIAHLLKVKPAVVTKQIDKLVEREWVERCYDERDRRHILLGLTEKGFCEIHRLIKKREEILHHLAESFLSPSEVQFLNELLVRMTSS